ncbi:HAMP domain-containing sensor histidine kinase [Cytophagales bacterium LB-30]|uniref:histidine kinase n=1 Tax=Shiella aurantiaca TaxID=3058365 RepID=A0ABT8F7C4_9BACT|nr:HAMP domain-containing sensor histidine kinase [Shiella aurantiaca]MDN4166298.1 HAMP domain-containing sensor histidine kinase [Shiella aurantiaca]
MNTSFFQLTSNRIILAVLLGIILISSYFTASTYLLYLNKSQETVYTKLEAILATTVISINPDDHRILLERYPQRDAIEALETAYLYRKIHLKLQESDTANNLRYPLHTLVFDSVKSQLLYAVSSLDSFYYLHPYPDLSAEQIQYLDTLTQPYIYSDAEKNRIIGIAPITHANGQRVAFLALEQPFDYFKQNALRGLARNGLISLGVVLLVAFFLSRFIKNYVSREEDLSESLRGQFYKIAAQKEEIETQNQYIQENNLKLEEAYRTIEKQNKELKIINQMLDFKVEQRTKELEKANNDLGTFLYRSSHDIIGPIATLNGLVSLANMEVKDNQGKEYVKKIGLTTKKLSAIIKHINVVFEIKNRDFSESQFSLHEVTEQAIEDLKAYYPEEQKIRFLNEIPTDFLLESDRDFMYIVLFELIKNSILFQSRTESEPFVEIRSEVSGNKIELFVRDNGIGIDPSTERKIFDMFQRSTEISQGSGLGLYVAKSIILRMKGKIQLISSESKGATFQIRLPLKGAATAANPYLG